MENILQKDLNPIQEEAVKTINGASYKGINPTNILSLTFTNKAAGEMKARIKEMLGDKANSLWMGTFHSIFSKILRFEAEHLGYTSSYTIYDQTDSKNAIKKIILSLNLDPKQYPPNNIQSRISKAKNNLMTATAYRNKPELIEQDKKRQQGFFIDIYEKYNQQCRKDNVMDFDDLLVNTNILFKKFPEILAKYQEKFQYILVDEYQDTNYAQYLILKSLAGAHKNISVVGDDAQSIYAFRGARIENILNFKNDYPNYKIFKLEQNYRSTKTIVNAANSLIANNQNQIKKNVFSENTQGEPIKVFEASTDSEEALFIADDIFETQMNTQKSLDEFAILYRTNAQSRQLEEALRKKNLKYKIYGGLSFYQRKEIKDTIAYFRLTVNPKDNEALRRIINFPSRKIGLKTVENLDKFAEKQGISLWETIDDNNIINTGLNAGTIKRIREFAMLIQSFQAMNEETDALSLANHIIKTSGIHYTLLNDKSPEGVSRFENVQELLNGIQDYIDEVKLNDENAFVRLTDYLENVALLTTQDATKDNDEPKVSLMTIHASKGLEFDNVYIAGMEEDLFPGRLSTFSRFDLEEERRLFYVAMTRAREKLVLTHAGSRYKHGQVQFNDRSRFINDINPEFLNFESNGNSSSNPFDVMFDEPEKTFFKPTSKPFERKETVSRKQEFSSHRNLRPMHTVSNNDINTEETTDHSLLCEGCMVKHARFGIGKIISIQRQGNDKKAVVDFEKHGQKNLLLKFAKLKRID